jgi:hypothetical protein
MPLSADQIRGEPSGNESILRFLGDSRASYHPTYHTTGSESPMHVPSMRENGQRYRTKEVQNHVRSLEASN